MPLPLLIVAGTGLAGIFGMKQAAHGVENLNKAQNTMEEAQKLHQRCMDLFERKNKNTSRDMDKLGKLELEILQSFNEFSEVFEKIKSKPKFEEYSNNDLELPKYDVEEIREVSIGAGVLLGAIGGAGLGAVGGFAASGATSAAVIAFGTASTGAPIVSLSGMALTNATLATLGGGSLASGGGGILLGTMVLDAATLGTGLMIGGIVFNFAGKKLSAKADKALEQVKGEEIQVREICKYLAELSKVSENYYTVLAGVNEHYKRHMRALKTVVLLKGHTDWNTFADDEKRLTHNTVLLVNLLYNMCKVKLVLKSDKENGINEINTVEVDKFIHQAKAKYNV